MQSAYLGIDGAASNAATTNWSAIHGLQTLGMNTRFNLSQVFEIGQLSLYENYEDVPDIEVTAEKVLDGFPLMYHLATNNATASTLVGRVQPKCAMLVQLYPDTDLAATGNAVSQVFATGIYVQQMTYRAVIEGPATEAITFVGNNKVWAPGAPLVFNSPQNPYGSDLPFLSGFVNRRQHVVFNGSQVPATILASFPPTGFAQQCTLLPLDIPGVSTSGTNDLNADGSYNVHLRTISHSVNLGRDQLLELGRRGPYFRYVNFPVEVRSEYELIAINGDLVNALENGAQAGGQNVATQILALKMQEGTYVNCGTKNKLTSITYGGANANTRGGNATMTFSYLTFNDFTVLHPQDPANLSQ